MFKFTKADHQISKLFLVAVTLSLFCNSLGVNGENEELVADEAVVAQPPQCIYHCERPYQPLCGSDGKTYGNICHLNTKNRCFGTHIRKVHDGTCAQQHCVFDPNPLVCNHCIFCPANRICTRCSNLNCTNFNSPVCGTNGVTYRNACQLALRTSSDCLGYPVRRCHNGPCP